MSALVELLRPATDDAVTRYLHRTEFRAWHKRRGVSPDNCPACIDQRQQAEAERYERTRLTVVDEVSPLQPWQRKLANEVLEAKTAELDAVVAETETSPALKAYLEEHKLVPDPPHGRAERLLDDDRQRSSAVRCIIRDEGCSNSEEGGHARIPRNYGVNRL